MARTAEGPEPDSLETVNGCNVGMVEGGPYLCFTLESSEAVPGCSGDEVGENLNRDVAIATVCRGARYPSPMPPAPRGERTS